MLGVSICGWFALCFNMRKTKGCREPLSLWKRAKESVPKCVNTLFKRWLGYHIMNISPYYTIRCDVYVVCLRTAVKSVCYRVVQYKQMHEAPDSKPLLLDGKTLGISESLTIDFLYSHRFTSWLGKRSQINFPVSISIMKSHQRIQHHLKPTKKVIAYSSPFTTISFRIPDGLPFFLNGPGGLVRTSRLGKSQSESKRIDDLMFSRQRKSRRVCKDTVVGRDPATPGMYNRPTHNSKKIGKNKNNQTIPINHSSSYFRQAYHCFFSIYALSGSSDLPSCKKWSRPLSSKKRSKKLLSDNCLPKILFKIKGLERFFACGNWRPV